MAGRSHWFSKLCSWFCLYRDFISKKKIFDFDFFGWSCFRKLIYTYYNMSGNSGYIQFNTPMFVDFNFKPKIKPMTMKSLFSDNSLVYYKKGSLAPGGIGTVSNSRIKSRLT